MKPVQDPTKYYSQYQYSPTGKARKDDTYEDYVNFYKNHWSGSEKVDQYVQQGDVNGIITRKNLKMQTIKIDPMWYDWQAINSNALTALQGIGVFLLLNIVALKIALFFVCKRLK